MLQNFDDENGVSIDVSHIDVVSLYNPLRKDEIDMENDDVSVIGGAANM